MIKTRHLTIVDSPPLLKETAIIVDWLNDPDVVRYSEQRHRLHTIKSQKAFLENLSPLDHYLLVKLHDGKLIGTMTTRWDRANNVTDVGILMGDKTEWNKGYGFEAWKGVCDRLLTASRKIEAGCMSANTAMIRICEKYGMKLEGIREGHFVTSTSSHPRTGMVLYGKFANDQEGKVRSIV